mmetsp:Transcript_79610/g.170717  ORF Transcript_79610/g.170717 Transcript_79610/m.170717 type:complete len:129 (-) Transcript_79610:146-532(-)
MKADEEARAKQAAMGQAGQEAQLEKMQEQQRQQQAQEEQKRIMIRQLLDADALERLNRLGLVKPEKKLQVEGAILQMAQGGQMMEKMSDTALTNLIEKVNTATKPQTSVKFQRKRRDDDDSDIDLDNL